MLYNKCGAFFKGLCLVSVYIEWKTGPLLYTSQFLSLYFESMKFIYEIYKFHPFLPGKRKNRVK